MACLQRWAEDHWRSPKGPLGFDFAILLLLTQETTTGTLSYQPALAVAHDPPADTLRLRIGGENVVATGIHRFWKAGQGWAKARDLKVGDTIRRLSDVARVESVSADLLQPVFHLEVARGSSFFVGRLGALVHDNSLVQAVARPFDAVAQGR